MADPPAARPPRGGQQQPGPGPGPGAPLPGGPGLGRDWAALAAFQEARREGRRRAEGAGPFPLESARPGPTLLKALAEAFERRPGIGGFPAWVEGLEARLR